MTAHVCSQGVRENGRDGARDLGDCEMMPSTKAGLEFSVRAGVGETRAGDARDEHTHSIDAKRIGDK